MRTAETRDLMVARVESAFSTYPRFEDLPEVEAPEGALLVAVEVPVTDATYVAALYEVCALGEPTGRSAGALVGQRIDVDAPVGGKRLIAGRGKGA